MARSSRPTSAPRVARRPTAREQEQAAALRASPHPPPAVPLAHTPVGEALAMLRRRGFRPRPGAADLPFPPDLDEARQARFARLLGHYAFRLFLRGVIQRPEGLRPAEATRYLDGEAAERMAADLVGLGFARRSGRGLLRLVHPPRSFGGTLEWYIARELRVRLGFDAVSGLRFGAPGVGGDLDVLAAAEGRLVYLEAKSSPPRQLADGEVAAFFDRVEALRPDLALFVMDTALRLGDKVVPMLVDELARRTGRPAAPRRVGRELWSLTPRLYAVSAKGDLASNLTRGIAEGLRALAPPV